MTMSDAILGLAGLFFLWAQNQGFRRQNDIFAITAGSEPLMPARRMSDFSLKRYWPLLAMVVLVGTQWIWFWAKDHISTNTIRSNDSYAPWVLGIGIALMVGHTLRTNWLDKKSIQSMIESKEAIPKLTEKPHRLKIISAHWGVEGLLGGDLDRVDCLLERQSGNVFAELVGLDLFHGCIPAPGPKRVKVKYSFDGREAVAVRQEGEFLMLPEDPYLKGKLDMFSPLQIEAFILAKQLRDFYASLGPYPHNALIDPPQLAHEGTSEYMDRIIPIRRAALEKWEQKLYHGYANRRIGQRVADILHRAGEEFGLGFSGLLSNSSEIGPSYTSYGIPKLAQEMEMVAIWINRKQAGEDDLVSQNVP